ncbi:MAG: vWA domain-containing protein [Desulfurococcaceae archaeon]
MNYMYPQLIYLIPLTLVVTYFVMAYGRKVFLSRIFKFRHTFTRYIVENYRWKRDLEWYLNYIITSIILILILISATIPYTTTRQYIQLYQQAETLLSINRKIPVVILLDFSGSMLGEKIRTALKAVREYVKSVGDSVLIGLIPFCDHPISPTPPTDNVELLYSKLDQLEKWTPSGGTIYSKALQLALDWLIPYTYFNLTPFIIFVTDGLPYEQDTPYYRSVVDKYVEYRIPVYSILIYLPGEEDEYALTVLSEIVETTKGKLYSIEKLSDFIKYFKELAELTIAETSKYNYETVIKYPYEVRLYLVSEYIVPVLVVFLAYSLTRILVYKTTL